MTDREFENYLALLSGMLRLRRTQRESISGELRDHLIEHVAHLEASGSTHEVAVRRALEEFGDAAALAANFSALVGMRRRRLIMRCTIGTTVVMTGLVVAMLAFRPEVRDDPNVAQAQAEAAATNGSEPKAPDQIDPSSEEARIARITSTNRNEFANEATRRKLDKLIDVRFVEEPLSTVLASLSKQVDIQFHLDPKALVDLAITSDDPITFRLNQVPAEMALDLMLRPIQLAYTLRSGVVMVSSQAELDAQVETRVYYVSEDSANELMQLIPSSLVPTTWDSAGGLGSIRPFRDSLVISQTSEAHQKIDKLLKDLEPVLAKGPRKAAESAEGSGYGAADRAGYGAVGYGSTTRGGYGGGGGYGSTSSSGGYGVVGGKAGYGAGSQRGDGRADPERREGRRGRNAPSRGSKPTTTVESATGDSSFQPAEGSPIPPVTAPDESAAEPTAAK